MRTSYSALDTYKTCPLKYKFAQIDKIKGEKSKEQVFGTAVHKALQFMFNRTPLFPTLDEVLNFYADYWGGVKDKIKVADKEKEFYLEEGKSILKKFFLKNQPWNFNVLDLESRFEVLIDDPERGENHVLAGIIDRVDKPADGSYEIIDYKTSRKMPSQEMVDKNLQLSIYNLGLTRRWPHIKPEQVKLSLYFLRAEEKISTFRSPEALAHAENEILSQVRIIEEKTQENDFPPVPSALCDWCGYKPICPAWRHLYEKEKKPEIQSAINEFLELKREIDERKKKLISLASIVREYMQIEKLERVFGDMGSILQSRQERASWDSEKVREILSGSNILDSVMTVDPQKLSFIVRSLPDEIQEKLKKEARTVKTFVVLKVSRKKEKAPE